jgi:V-type H+-transporting ATPase subunit a
MIYSGRYIVLLMGCFSMYFLEKFVSDIRYTGLIYNDLFSKPISLFRSGWEWPEKFEVGQLVTAKQVGVYPLGLDPGWHIADNALLFSNSYKMKLSVVLGIIHVSFFPTFKAYRR